VQTHPQTFSFVENLGNIPENLGKISENLDKMFENPSKISENLDKFPENPGKNGKNGAPHFLSSKNGARRLLKNTLRHFFLEGRSNIGLCDLGGRKFLSKSRTKTFG